MASNAEPTVESLSTSLATARSRVEELEGEVKRLKKQRGDFGWFAFRGCYIYEGADETLRLLATASGMSVEAVVAMLGHQLVDVVDDIRKRAAQRNQTNASISEVTAIIAALASPPTDTPATAAAEGSP